MVYIEASNFIVINYVEREAPPNLSDVISLALLPFRI
jgi:hypothetical protein